MRPMTLSLSISFLFLILVGAQAGHTRPPRPDQAKVFVVDGSFVHDVGDLNLNITNWGLIGSRPNSSTAFSHAPSAEFPAGSGREFLFSAGLWVGALVDGVPRVSTGQYATEILPDPNDPFDTIFRSSPGAPGGNRFPDPGEDDDSDGLLNEDPRNALDDDADGLIDEDFAVIGDQHFRAVMRDDTALASSLNPDHEPLGIKVVQESFQWSDDEADHFVGFQFTITNVGDRVLEDLYIGFFADFDVGMREPGYFNDDVYFLLDETIPVGDGSVMPLRGIAMSSEGWSQRVGLQVLGYETDPIGLLAPSEPLKPNVNAIQSGMAFTAGGFPTNDSEQYTLMAGHDLFNVATAPSDYQTLVSVGPFPSFEPGRSTRFHIAMVGGVGVEGYKRAAAEAILVYEGAAFDRDFIPSTGIRGRETKACALDPNDPNDPIFSMFVDCVTAEDLQGPNPPAPISPEDLDEDGCIFVNADCSYEAVRTSPGTDCTLDGLVPPSELAGCTGTQGKEFPLRWYFAGPGPVPALVGDISAQQTPRGIEVRAGLNLPTNLPVQVVRREESELSRRVWPIEAGESTLLVIDDEPGVGERVYDLQVDAGRGFERLATTRFSTLAPRFGLRSWPNPANPMVSILYTVELAGDVTLDVFDTRGRRVRSLLRAAKNAGEHTIRWNGLDDAGLAVASGVYHVRFTSQNRETSRAVTLVR